MRTCRTIKAMSLVVGLLLLTGQIHLAAGGEFTIVVPNGFEDVEGNDGDLGDGAFVSGFRSQSVFDSSQFESLPASQHLLTGFRNRPDGQLPFPLTRTQSDLTLRVSTTTRRPGTLSNNFASNYGDDVTLVYDGPITFSTDNTGIPGGPKDFDYGVIFQTPFHYDPAEGHLLLEWIVEGTSPLIGSDSNKSLDNPVEWVFRNDPNATTANFRGTSTDIFQFTFIPEPSTLLLGAMATVGMLIRRRSLQ